MSVSATHPLAASYEIPAAETCPFGTTEIDTIRYRIHELNDALDLWPGIQKCMSSGDPWKAYADYQLAWNWDVLYGDAIQNCWVGARFTSKSETTIEALVRKMATQPQTLVSYIPGGNMRQNAEPSRYFNTLVNNSSVLKDYKAEPWQEAIKVFSNGSRIWFLPPTLDGVQSMRGNVLIFDEAQALEQDVQVAALPQGGAKGSRRFYTGISVAGTILDTVYRYSPVTKFKIRTPVTSAVNAGIVDQAYVDSVIFADMLTQDEIDVIYNCKWVKGSDRVFNPQIISELDKDMEGVRINQALGVDFNPSAGHWGVLVFQDFNGNIVCIKEFPGIKNFEGVLEMGDMDVPIHAEDGGTNTGYCDALQLANSRRLEHREIIREAWDDIVKGQQVSTILLLQDNKKWFIYKRGCPILTRDIVRVPFNDKGVPDKDAAKKLRPAVNMHVIDACIHAVAAAATDTATSYILRVWNS